MSRAALAAMVLVAFATSAQEAAEVEALTQIRFPREVELDGETYRLQGTAARRIQILFVSLDVYAVGHYTSPRDATLRAFRVVAARDLSRDRIVGALQEALAKHGSAAEAAAVGLLARVRDRKKGEVTWYYNTTADELRFQQERVDAAPLVLEGGALVEALYGQWISPRLAVSADLPKRLLGKDPR